MSSYIIIDSSDAVTMQKPGLAGGEWFHTLSEAVEYYMDRGWECQGAPRPSSCTRLVQGPHPEEAYRWVEARDPRMCGSQLPETRRFDRHAKFVPKQASMSVWGGDALNNTVYGINALGTSETHYSLAFEGYSQCLTHVPTSGHACDCVAQPGGRLVKRKRLAAE
jgi:hypothetical protein